MEEEEMKMPEDPAVEDILDGVVTDEEVTEQV